MKNYANMLLYSLIQKLVILTGISIIFTISAQEPAPRTITKDIAVNQAHEQTVGNKTFHFHHAIPQLRFLAATRMPTEGAAVNPALITGKPLNFSALYDVAFTCQYTLNRTHTQSVDNDVINAIRGNSSDYLKRVLNRTPITECCFNKLLTYAIAYNTLLSNTNTEKNWLLEFLLHRGHHVPQRTLAYTLQKAIDTGAHAIIERLTGPEAQNRGTSLGYLRNNHYLQGEHGWQEYPLHQAIFDGHITDLSSLDAFLQEHQNTSIESEDNILWTPLHVAAYSGNSGATQALLQKNASINAETMDRDTPLHLAAAGGHLDTAQCLLTNEARSGTHNGEMRTPLYYAACNGHTHLVELLLDSTPTWELLRPQIVNPLAIAIHHGHADIAHLLLKKYYTATIAETNESRFTSPLCYAASTEHTDILFDLLKNFPTDVQAHDPYTYQTALQIAVEHNNLQAADLLMEHGARSTVVNALGNTPLSTALRNRNLNMLQCILEHTPTTITGPLDYQFLNGQGEQPEEPLLTALRTNFNQAIAPLLKHPATGLTAANPKSVQWALHSAVLKRNTGALKLLIDNDADLTQINKNGETPLDVACRIGFDEGATLLKNRMLINQVLISPNTDGTVTLNPSQQRKRSTSYDTETIHKKHAPRLMHNTNW